MTTNEKELLYTCRWNAMQIARYSSDAKIDLFALNQIEIISQLLGVSIPEEFRSPEPPRPNVNPENNTTNPPQLGFKKWPANEKKLWYPDAVVRQDIKRAARGTYPNQYPIGAIVHFTAGHYSQGVSNAVNSIASSPYFFCSIGIDGKFVQANPFNQWGSHAGESSWVFNGQKHSGVSSLLVGIEMNNPGRLVKKDDGFYTYWDEKFAQPIDKKIVRTFDKDKENIQAGHYLPYTKEQESGLVEFLLWAKRNNPDVFNLDYVLGHDEVAGDTTYADEASGFGLSHDRKNDPGGALSMTMPELREHLKTEYKKRYMATKS